MHSYLLRTRAVALVLIAALCLASPHHAAATVKENHDSKNSYILSFLDPFGWIHFLDYSQSGSSPPPNVVTRSTGTIEKGDRRVAATPSSGAAATFYMFNYDATLEPGEPNPGGLMTRTVWGGSTVKQAGRVVIHTFGSKNFDTGGQLNTVLAAYRGTAFSNLVPLAANDDKAVPGFSSVQSLIQFDVAANTPYRVQIGGRAGVEGDIYATVSVLPPGGGLSAFLATYAGFSFEGRDYICELTYTSANHCWPAKFIIHNSTNQTLTVTPTTSLGGAFVNPAAFALAPGEVKTVEFIYNSGFNKTTLRTIAGDFKFTGRNGATVVSEAFVRGLVVVKSQTGYGPDVLGASVARQVGTEFVNNALPFDVKLTNTGSQAATGCHARSEVYSRVQTIWQEYDPGGIGTSRPATIGAPNVPVTIPAGGFKWLRVWVASQTPRDAAPDFEGEIIVDCANTAELAFNVANRFDLTAFGSFALREVDVAAVSPTNGLLNVPPTGTAVFRTSTINRGPAATMRAYGLYAGPFDDPANSEFVVTGVCEANAAGTCISGQPTGVLIYTAPTNVRKYFNVFVRAPTVNPGYHPGKRRVFLNVEQGTPDNVTSDYVLVGTRSIAVKKL